jgi:BolA protein
MTIQNTITDKLQQALPIEHLEVINESHMHNVPPGSESHFKVVIVSDAFTGKLPLARHRMINTILEQELASTIHALALHTMTMHEWFDRGEAPQSPPCMGGDGVNT